MLCLNNRYVLAYFQSPTAVPLVDWQGLLLLILLFFASSERIRLVPGYWIPDTALW